MTIVHNQGKWLESFASIRMVFLNEVSINQVHCFLMVIIMSMHLDSWFNASVTGPVWKGNKRNPAYLLFMNYWTNIMQIKEIKQPQPRNAEDVEEVTNLQPETHDCFDFQSARSSILGWKGWKYGVKFSNLWLGKIIHLLSHQNINGIDFYIQLVYGETVTTKCIFPLASTLKQC